ncbi:MAG: peptidoglycan recognition family protein [Saprospiraceae bacterium]
MYRTKFYLILLLLTGVCWLQFSCSTKKGANPIKNLKIVDKPIVWDTLRKRLSLEYMHEHYGMTDVRAPLITPSMVVVHWTAIPTLAASFNTFKPAILEGREDLQKASTLNVSVQFLVDRDGTIYRLLPETAFARHVIGLNHCAIGIENVGDGDQYKLTDAQFKANVQLIQYLHYKYPIRFVIGHHDYTKFKDHPLWKETDPNYLTEKTDPGDAWMERLYLALSKEGVYGISRFPKKVE